MTKRRTQFVAASIIGLALTGTGLAVAGAAPPAYNSNQEPSCSLHPFKLDPGEYFFQNQNPNGDWPIPLTIWNADNTEVIYQAFLSTGDSTPILNLSLASGIGWSNNADGPDDDPWDDVLSATYSVGDYEQVNWCTTPEESTTTTQQETTTTTTAPTTTTTQPVVTTTTPEPTTSTTPTTQVTNPPVVSTEPTLGVAGVVVTAVAAKAPAPLPTTGPIGVRVMLACAVVFILAGVAAIKRSFA